MGHAVIVGSGPGRPVSRSERGRGFRRHPYYLSLEHRSLGGIVMRHDWLIWAALLALLAPGFASAQDYDRFGPYIGAGGSFVTAIWEDDLEDELGVSVDVDDAWGANARLGLRLLSFLAVEAQYEWLDDYGVEVAGIDIAKLESHALTGNLKLFLPIWRVQPYLLAGVGFADIDLEDKIGFGLSGSETNLAFRGGLGFDVYVTEHIALYAEGSVLLVDQDIDTGIAGVDKVEPLIFTGAQLGLMFRF
jgi:opacity protein-like surface antigen